MVYKFRIISDENKEFARELIVDGKNTFLEFHQCLQENLDYDPAQLSSFFITNSSWEKQVQITLIDMMDEESENCTTMDVSVIQEHFSEKGDRMLYVYDFFSERSFFIELTEVLNMPESKALPKVVFSHGSPPPQIDLKINDPGLTDDDLLSDDFSGNSFDDSNDDELDFTDPDNFPNE